VPLWVSSNKNSFNGFVLFSSEEIYVELKPYYGNNEAKIMRDF
jgi:hypothetical protein